MGGAGWHWSRESHGPRSRRREEVEEGVEGGGKENLTSTTQRSRCAACVPKARIYARRTTWTCGDVAARRTTETETGRKDGDREEYTRRSTRLRANPSPEQNAKSRKENQKPDSTPSPAPNQALDRWHALPVHLAQGTKPKKRTEQNGAPEPVQQIKTYEARDQKMTSREEGGEEGGRGKLNAERCTVGRGAVKGQAPGTGRTATT
ncbi:hypothetical protein B0H13DRAFT_1914766 [Mycena leptocephala]|nr:hypothetical protein B0H13DRAFT_1914766 [Mycena leptocephala]